MKNLRKILWGTALIAIDVLYVMRVLNLLPFDLLFDGWWTLFIIVPCAVDLITERDKTGSLIGLSIGVGLLLWRQDILDIGRLWKLLISVVVVVIGLKLIFGGLFDKKTEAVFSEIKKEGKTVRSSSAIFSGNDCKVDGEVFEGAELNAVFGGVEYDLRNAIFEKDCAIKATAVFGGIDILVPDHVKVVVNSTGIFGGTSNKAKSLGNTVTLYVSATSLFGGVDIK